MIWAWLRLPEKSLLPPWVWKSAITAAVIWSFIQANLGQPGALRLWLEAPDAIFILLSLGLGLSWVRDAVNARLAGGSPPSAPEKEEPIP